jgi:hypothetical protein
MINYNNYLQTYKQLLLKMPRSNNDLVTKRQRHLLNCIAPKVNEITSQSWGAQNLTGDIWKLSGPSIQL